MASSTWPAQSRGGPVIANGLVWVGTNNQQPRDPKNLGDAAVLMCFRESDGKFLYQYVSPRRDDEPGKTFDNQRGSLPAPLVEKDRLWLVTNRCEVLCLDIGPLQSGRGQPTVLWKIDMVKELGIHPTWMCPGTLLPFCAIGASYKDFIYVAAMNGERNEPIKEAPNLICFNKHTGAIVWKDAPVGTKLVTQPFANPLLFDVGGHAQVAVGRGDGWLRSYDAETGKLIWQCDLNSKNAGPHIGDRDGLRVPIATPVVCESRIYLGIGNSEGGFSSGPSNFPSFFCLDATKKGNISAELKGVAGKNPNSGVLWHFGGLVPPEAKNQERKFLLDNVTASCVVKEGLVYLPETNGYLHCLDAISGKKYWTHDLRSTWYTAPLWVDGKIYAAGDDGFVWIFAHGKNKRDPIKIDMDNSIPTAPVFANGVLYVLTDDTLYAIREE